MWLRRSRTMMTSMLHRLNKNVALAAVDEWCAWVRSQQHHRAAKLAFKEGIKRTETRLLVAAIEEWRAWVGARRHVQRQVARCLAHVRNSMICRIWHRWFVVVATEAAHKRKLAKLIRSFANFAVVRAWRVWYALVQYSKRKHRAAELLVARIGSSVIWSAFNAWLDQTQFVVRARSVISHTIARMQRRTVAAVLTQWSAIAHANKCLQRVATQFVARTAQCTLAYIWQRWIRQHDSKMNGLNKMSKLVGILRSIKARTAWRTWTIEVQKIKTERGVMKRIALRIQHRLATGAFSSWRALVDFRHRSRAVVAHSINRIQRGLAGTTFFTTARASSCSAPDGADGSQFARWCLLRMARLYCRGSEGEEAHTCGCNPGR